MVKKKLLLNLRDTSEEEKNPKWSDMVPWENSTQMVSSLPGVDVFSFMFVVLGRV